MIISNSTDEYLRRFYKYEEISERIPKIAKYYRNYLLFFCKPIFTNLFINKLIHVYGEFKGELYYNANYGNKNKDKMEKKENEKNKLQSSDFFNKNKGKPIEMLFNSIIKNDIEKNSMTISTIVKDLSYLNMNPLNLDTQTNNFQYGTKLTNIIDKNKKLNNNNINSNNINKKNKNNLLDLNNKINLIVNDSNKINSNFKSDIVNLYNNLLISKNNKKQNFNKIIDKSAKSKNIF